MACPIKRRTGEKIGMEGNFDTEIIIASQPDIIFVSPNRRGGYEVMKELNIPLVPYWAFKETSHWDCPNGSR